MNSFKLSRISAAAVALAAAAMAGNALASTTTGTLTVTASVASVCLISNGTLAFGSYDPTSGAVLNGATTLTLTCTPGTTYDIGMDAGAGSGATTALRKMTSGSNTLSYKLFRDSGRTLNWGNTVATDTLHATTSALSLANTINVYGQIPASEVSAAGSYSDSVTVTVTY